jgi:type II secretion system protein H
MIKACPVPVFNAKHCARKRAVKGFTLLELIVVMIIVALSVGIIAPRFSGSELSQLKAQTREIVSIFNYARRMAVVTGQVQTVWLQVMAEENAAPPATRPQRSTQDRWVSRGAAIEWENDAPTQENNAYKIEFFPAGGTSGSSFTLQQGDFKMHVELHPLTGKSQVSLEE